MCTFNSLKERSKIYEKKNIKTLLVIVALLSFTCGTTTVFAANSTGTILGPDMYSGRTSTTNTYNLTSNTLNSITGNDVSTTFTNFGYLYNTVTWSNARRMTVKLYEDDVYPNADDLVKTYVFDFNGKYVNNIISIVTNDTGNIDSAGDNTVEMYLTSYMSAIGGDTSANQGPLYSFSINVR